MKSRLEFFNLMKNGDLLAPRRQGRKEKIFSSFSELGALCVFARSILTLRAALLRRGLKSFLTENPE
ncbi:MAG TPA: hypothetical protein VIE89_16795 [Candidatus Binatia bacterium]|jgi:hypothetical protein